MLLPNNNTGKTISDVSLDTKMNRKELNSGSVIIANQNINTTQQVEENVVYAIPGSPG